jgi:hypothetical protein
MGWAFRPRNFMKNLVLRALGDFLWGRLLTCGRLAIGLLAVRASLGGCIYRPGWFSTLSLCGRAKVSGKWHYSG